MLYRHTIIVNFCDIKDIGWIKVDTGQITYCLNYVEAVTLRVLELSESQD